MQWRGAWVAQWVKPLPSAQVMISGSWDRVPHRAPCSAGSLLPPLLSLPASLPTCDLSLSNKKKSLKEIKTEVESGKKKSSCKSICKNSATSFQQMLRSLGEMMLENKTWTVGTMGNLTPLPSSKTRLFPCCSWGRIKVKGMISDSNRYSKEAKIENSGQIKSRS